MHANKIRLVGHGVNGRNGYRFYLETDAGQIFSITIYPGRFSDKVELAFGELKPAIPDASKAGSYFMNPVFGANSIMLAGMKFHSLHGSKVLLLTQAYVRNSLSNATSGISAFHIFSRALSTNMGELFKTITDSLRVEPNENKDQIAASLKTTLKKISDELHHPYRYASKVHDAPLVERMNDLALGLSLNGVEKAFNAADRTLQRLLSLPGKVDLRTRFGTTVPGE